MCKHRYKDKVQQIVIIYSSQLHFSKQWLSFNRFSNILIRSEAFVYSNINLYDYKPIMQKRYIMDNKNSPQIGKILILNFSKLNIEKGS